MKKSENGFLFYKLDCYSSILELDSFPNSTSKTWLDFDEFCKNTSKKDIMVIFPESSTTNGKCILQFDCSAFPVEQEKIFVSCLKYSSNILPFIIPHSLFTNFFSCLFNFWNSFSFKMFSLCSIVPHLESNKDAIQESMQLISKLKMIKLNSKDKESFIQYYHQKQNK